MTPDAFQQLWDKIAPTVPPIAYLFKWRLSERWFRVHSLPSSKRYADTPIEWTILLDRQQSILADLSKEITQIILVTSFFDNDDSRFFDKFTEEVPVFSGLKFIQVEKVDLHKLEPDNYSAGMFCHPIATELALDAPQIEPILRAIANDEISAFFINPVSGFIIAPYDGGVDIILPNNDLRNHYRSKYREWLSERTDGF